MTMMTLLCKACRSPLRTGVHFCVRCGCPAEPDTSDATAGQAPRSGDMIALTYLKEALGAAPHPPPPAPQRCPACDRPLRTRANFCGHCGGRVGAPGLLPDLEERPVARPAPDAARSAWRATLAIGPAGVTWLHHGRVSAVA